MARPAAGCKQEDVDPHVVPRLHPAVSTRLYRRAHAPQAPFVNRKVEVGGVCPPFDLDESHQSAAPGNQIDLSARGLHAAGEHPPAFELQVPGGKRLALAGAIGACLAGIAPTAINLLFSAAK